MRCKHTNVWYLGEHIACIATRGLTISLRDALRAMNPLMSSSNERDG